MADYIPASDADLLQFTNNFQSTLASIEEVVLQTEGPAGEVGELKNAFATALTNHVNAQTAAQAATQTKNQARADLVEKLRAVTRRVQASGHVTDAHRADLGITIAASNQTSVGAPTTRPVLSVNTSQRLQHIVNFQDETTPTSRAKPAGVLGCEIFVFVGTQPPASVDQYRFLTVDTATPHIVNFSENDGGKTAYYIARWTNRAGDKGSWSAVSSATIVA